MINKTLTKFLLEGNIGLNRIGKPIDLTEGRYDTSVEKHFTGIPVLYTWFYEGLEISLGTTADNKVDYLVVHISKQDCNFDIGHNKSNLNLLTCTLEQFVCFLNSNQVSWRFNGINDCFIFIELTKTGIEVLFSYYPGDRTGLSFVQNQLPKNNLNRISRTTQGWIYVNEKVYGTLEYNPDIDNIAHQINGKLDNHSEWENRFSSLDDSLTFFINHDIKWFFYGIKDKYVSILIPRYKLLFVYCFEPTDNIGFQSIRTDDILILDKDSIKVAKGYFYLSK